MSGGIFQTCVVEGRDISHTNVWRYFSVIPVSEGIYYTCVEEEGVQFLYSVHLFFIPVFKRRKGGNKNVSYLCLREGGGGTFISHTCVCGYFLTMAFLWKARLARRQMPQECLLCPTSATRPLACRGAVSVPTPTVASMPR